MWIAGSSFTVSILVGIFGNSIQIPCKIPDFSNI